MLVPTGKPKTQGQKVGGGTTVIRRIPFDLFEPGPAWSLRLLPPMLITENVSCHSVIRAHLDTLKCARKQFLCCNWTLNRWKAVPAHLKASRLILFVSLQESNFQRRFNQPKSSRTRSKLGHGLVMATWERVVGPWRKLGSVQWLSHSACRSCLISSFLTSGGAAG